MTTLSPSGPASTSAATEVAPRLRRFAIAAQAGLALRVVVEAGLLIALLTAPRVVHRDVVGESTASLGDAAAADQSAHVWFGVDLAVSVVVAMAWLSWFWNARVAADRYDPPIPYHRAWAFWGWIVPFVNLGAPWHMTQNVLDAVTRHDGMSDADERGRRRVRVLITTWWSITLAGGATASFAMLVLRDSDDVRVARVAAIVVFAADAVAAGLAAAVVQRITAVADRRRAAALLPAD